MKLYSRMVTARATIVAIEMLRSCNLKEWLVNDISGINGIRIDQAKAAWRDIR